jgi:hypothetical protein
MKQILLTLGFISATFYYASSQYKMTAHVPPFGSTSKMYKVNSTVIRASIGPNQVWNYNSITKSLMYTYQTVRLDTLSSALQSKFPSTSYVQMMLMGAPDLNLNAMEFIQNKTTHFARVGTKGSGSSSDIKNDTFFLFNHSFDSTVFYTPYAAWFAAHGKMNVDGKQFDSVVMMRYASGTDTMVNFFSLVPHFHKLFTYVISGGNVLNAYYYEPGTAINTGLSENNDAYFNCFPNPSSGNVTLLLNTIHSNPTVTVYDMSGRILQTDEYHNTDKMQLDLRLTQGFYWIEVKSSETIVRKKIAIE